MKPHDKRMDIEWSLQALTEEVARLKRLASLLTAEDNTVIQGCCVRLQQLTHAAHPHSLTLVK